ncbi:hypothetical protein A5647_21825 [Mycobacterium sp. 1100029.7]|nr:hypothetical protein A5647_21825 [Mycobacterium sp. 1100029.7]
MSGRWRGAVLLLAVMLATGCTSAIGGKAVPAPGPPLLGLLLDGATLAKILGQPFKNLPLRAPSYGGGEKFGTGYEDARPADCVGVVFMMQRSVYESVPVKDAVSETWANDGTAVKVNFVDEGVISFPSPKDAAAAFGKFAAQWQGCDGTTVTTHSLISAGNAISDVRVADSVAAASVVMHPHEHSILASEPVARALGVRGNYLVEVSVQFYGNDDPTARGSADINTSAVYIARAMMDRLALS